MEKDSVIWGGCIGLFLTGGLFAYGFSGSSSEGLKVVDVFAIISAVATAFAAFAAWRAASAAQKQSYDSAVSIRRQTHKTHVESFSEWLDGMEDELGVKFYRRYELYEAVFPNSRNPSFEFTEVGDYEVKAWQESYGRLVDMACAPSQPSLREVESWVADLMFLAGFMRCSLLSNAELQIYLDNRIPSGVSLDNYKRLLPVLGIVLSGISRFAFVEGRSSDRGISSEFEFAFSEFIQAVFNKSWNQHSYRIGTS